MLIIESFMGPYGELFTSFTTTHLHAHGAGAAAQRDALPTWEMLHHVKEKG